MWKRAGSMAGSSRPAYRPRRHAHPHRHAVCTPATSIWAAALQIRFEGTLLFGAHIMRSSQVHSISSRTRLPAYTTQTVVARSPCCCPSDSGDQRGGEGGGPGFAPWSSGRLYEPAGGLGAPLPPHIPIAHAYTHTPTYTPTHARIPHAHTHHRIHPRFAGQGDFR